MITGANEGSACARTAAEYAQKAVAAAVAKIFFMEPDLGGRLL